MAEKILFNKGGKGGVGKSMATRCGTDTALRLGCKVLGVDADFTNPSYFKTYKRQHDQNPAGPLFVNKLDLRKSAGWSHLVNLCHEFPDHLVIVDTPSGDHESFKRFSDILRSSLPELGRECELSFVTTGERDSVELFRDLLEMTDDGLIIHTIKNGFYADDDDDESYWARFNESKTLQKAERRGGQTVTVPKLARHIVNEIDWHRLTFAEAEKTLDIGNRNALSPWLATMREEFSKLIFEPA